MLSVQQAETSIYPLAQNYVFDLKNATLWVHSCCAGCFDAFVSHTHSHTHTVDCTVTPSRLLDNFNMLETWCRSIAGR